MRDGRLVLNDHRRTTSARVVGCERQEVDPKRPPPYNKCDIFYMTIENTICCVAYIAILYD